MMDMYSLQRLAHTEHDLMVRSLPPVSEHGDAVLVEQSPWLARLSVKPHAMTAYLRLAPCHQPRRTRPSLTVSNPSVFLRDQLRENSNYELDWLWAASQVAADEEIRYCLERALYINPDYQETQYMLSRLVAHRVPANEMQPANRQGFAQASDN